MSAYYNEHDPKAATWLRELVKAGLIAEGDVDERSIEDVSADDVRGYTQAHFFAGIGGWSYALRLAGWPDDRSVWTGSCPCQPFSSASRGRGGGWNGDRDLWPVWRQLIVSCRPHTVFGEQVAQSGDWLVRAWHEMEAGGYKFGAAILPACSVGADHIRQRVYFVGDANGDGQSGCTVDAQASRLLWDRRDARGVVPSNGLSRDVVALSGFGNAIVPQIAAEFIAAYLEVAA